MLSKIYCQPHGRDAEKDDSFYSKVPVNFVLKIEKQSDSDKDGQVTPKKCLCIRSQTYCFLIK